MSYQGESEQAPPLIAFTCPFCGLAAAAMHRPPAVAHDWPICPTFEAMEPDEYLAAVNQMERRKN